MRKARILVAGAVYHVVARTNRKEKLLGPLLAKELFLEIMAKAKLKLVTVRSYIDQNPVKAFLVERERDWPWSGLHHHRSGRTKLCEPPPLWLLLVAPAHAQVTVTFPLPQPQPTLMPQSG